MQELDSCVAVCYTAFQLSVSTLAIPISHVIKEQLDTFLFFGVTGTAVHFWDAPKI